MYDGNPGEIDFGSSYRESTVWKTFLRNSEVYFEENNVKENYSLKRLRRTLGLLIIDVAPS